MSPAMRRQPESRLPEPARAPAQERLAPPVVAATGHRPRWALSRWPSLPAPPQGRGPGLALVGLWVAVMTLAQVVRQPGVPSWDSVWQEDGGIFLTDALFESFSTALVHVYNAYLHVVPRIIAAFAAALPLDRAAMVLSLGSALVVALLSVYVYFASAWLLPSQWARLVLAGLFVLLPATAYETNANIANLHWYLLFACFWVFLARPRSRSEVVVGTAIAVATVLSDPMAGLFLPLAALMIRRRTGRRELVAPIAFFVALAVQLVLGAFSEAPEPYADSHLTDLPGVYALRVVGSFLVGDRHLHYFWQHLRWWFAVGSVVVLFAAVGYGLVKAHRPARLYAVVSLVYSFAFLAVPLMLRGTERFLDGPGFNLNGSRYTVVPLWFLLLAVLVLLDRPSATASQTGWQRVQQAFVVCVSALVLVNFSNFSVRTHGPSWREQLAVAQEQCALGQRPDVTPPGLGPEMVSRAEEHRADVLIPIAPNIRPHPFAVPMTCRRLSD